MRLLYIGAFYKGYLAHFYARHAKLALRPYAEQLRALQRDALGWTGAWSAALPSIGYAAEEIYPHVHPLGRAWWRENREAAAGEFSSLTIAVAQAAAFRPDVLFFDHQDRELLRALKERVASIRLVLSWEGSAIVRRELWNEVDVVLSCAPETVDQLRAAGARAEHLDHGFAQAVLRELQEGTPRHGLSFFGQILRSGDIHARRERLLEALVDSDVPFSIFSPSAALGWLNRAAALAHIAAYPMHQALRRVGVPKHVRESLPLWRLGEPAAPFPRMPVSRKLAPRLRPALYGLEMYQAMRDSAVVLNIHADSSPIHASNMRLFEITGAGACMLTDRKQNLGRFFAEDREVVTYGDAAECAEKARWLLEHPRERARIAAAGAERTLEQHTFAHRAPILDGIIRRYL